MFNPDDSYDEEMSGEYNKQYKSGKGNSKLNNEFYDQFSFKLNQSGQSMSRQQDGYKSENSISLRQNLQQLDKQQIIELLLQQIKSSSQGKQRYVNQVLNQPMYELTFGVKSKDNKNMVKYKQQYQQLVKDFQQYISNTRQAQQHYMKVIEDVKKENKSLYGQINKCKSSSSNAQLVNLENTTLVQKLQETVQKYLQINNELANKIQKLQRNSKQQTQQKSKLIKKTQKLQFELNVIQKQNQKLLNQNQTFRNIIQELKQYIKGTRQINQSRASNSCQNSVRQQKQKVNKNQQFKHQNESIMNSSQIKRNQITEPINESEDQIFINQSNKNIKSQFNQNNSSNNKLFSSHSDYQQEENNANTYHVMLIQNKQLKLTNMKLEELIERKSQKIRKLLDQIQQMGQQRIKLKQQIMTLKSVSKINQQNYKISNLSEYNLKANNNSQNEAMSYQIGGAKMVSSSLYSLKCSELSSDREVSKDHKTQFNTIKNVLAQKKALILQGYANCFKKSQSKTKLIYKQELDSKKIDKANSEDYYIAKVLFNSNKKINNSERQKNVEGNIQIKNQSYGMIKKRNNSNYMLESNSEELKKSVYSTGKNSKYLQQSQKEN